MKTITFHFYGIGSLGSALIAARLSSRITHCSMEFDDGVLYHSTMFGGCLRTTPDKLRTPIESVTIEVTKDKYYAMLQHAHSLTGVHYDFMALIGFLFAVKFENSKATFCSEFCNLVFDSAYPNPIKRRTLITPSEFRSYIEGFKLGKETD